MLMVVVCLVVFFFFFLHNTHHLFLIFVAAGGCYFAFFFNQNPHPRARAASTKLKRRLDEADLPVMGFGQAWTSTTAGICCVLFAWIFEGYL